MEAFSGLVSFCNWNLLLFSVGGVPFLLGHRNISWGFKPLFLARSTIYWGIVQGRAIKIAN